MSRAAAGSRRTGAGGPPEAALWGTVLGAWGLTTQLGWRLGLGLWGAQGGDAQLWGLSAEGLAHGVQAATPPLWPLLVGGLRLLGLPLVPAGWGLSLVLAALVPPAVFLAARALGARLPAALGAGLLAGALPDLLAWGSEVQSNSMIALGLVVATGLWARARQDAEATGRAGSFAVAAAVVTGLLPLVRETGTLAAAAVVLLGPVLLPGGWRFSLLTLATWWLSPVVVLAAPGLHPLDVPWAQRTDMVVADLLGGGTTGVGGRPPPYTAELPPAERGPYIGWLRQGDLHRLAAFHLQRTVHQAWDGLLLGGLAAAGVLWSWRRRPALRAAVLPLLTLAPTLVLWTQRRHVLLAVPALLAVCSALPWPRGALRSRWPTVLGLMVLGGALAAWPARGRVLAEGQQGESMRARSQAELAAWICSQPDVLLLSGPVHDVGLYCPLPRHELARDPAARTAADWHTVYVAPAVTPAAVLPAGLVATGPRVADLQAFQLRPEQPRPCADGRVSPGTPYLSAGPVHATLVGCSSSAPDAP